MTTIIDGKKIAAQIRHEIKNSLAHIKAVPGLAIIMLGDNPASKIYVKNKKMACQEVGIKAHIFNLPIKTTQEDLEALIRKLNKDKSVHGILIQLPLPKSIAVDSIFRTIKPNKDVDGLHPDNLSAIINNKANFIPCTPAGIMNLLKKYHIKIAEKNCVILGRSKIVGQPIAKLLSLAGGKITVCHSQTKNLNFHTSRADILVSAVGKAKLITADMLKPGVVVIDVGINHCENNRLCGDVDFANVKKIAAAITPVPGGVGPMTIALLLKNCLKAYQQNK